MVGDKCERRVDPRLELHVPSGFGERPLAAGGRRRRAVRDELHAGDELEGPCPCRAGGKLFEQLLEQLSGSPRVACSEQVVGEQEPARYRLIRAVWRRQPGGELRQLCRRLRGAAAIRPSGGPRETRCHLLVGSGGPEREMSRSLLRIGNDFGETEMHALFLVVGRRRVDRGRNQWMREPQPSRANLDHALALCAREPRRLSAKCARHEIGRRRRERGGGEKRLAGGRREPRQPIQDETGKRVRHRKRLTWVHLRTRANQRAGELERKQRIPP